MKLFKSLSLMVAAMAISAASFAQNLEVDNQTNESIGTIDVTYTNSSTDQFSVTTPGLHIFSASGTVQDAHTNGVTVTPGVTLTATLSSGTNVHVQMSPGGDKIVVWEELW